MRAITVLFFVVITIGCGTKSAVKPYLSPGDIAQQKNLSSHRNDHSSALEFLAAKGTPSLNEFLAKRKVVCTLEKKVQNEQMDRLRDDKSSMANLQLLLLSSCRPEMTPGIMRNALVNLRQDETLKSEYYSFFDLMTALLNATERTVNKQKSLIEQLNETVEELTKIERDIESRDKKINQSEPFSG